MSLRRLLPVLLAALALLLAPVGIGSALAHQQKIAISTVSLNARTGMIEIVHQVPVHNAEHALRVQGMASPDIIGSEKSREAFARYVTRRFLLEVNGKPAEPTYVGSDHRREPVGLSGSPGACRGQSSGPGGTAVRFADPHRCLGAAGEPGQYRRRHTPRDLYLQGRRRSPRGPAGSLN